ncbi:hypothetical protein Bbelb_107260 [Branchiostoma belcheri]|nr:hypothetical protein Bbelb_107260 [Branchiostoma belcheri]
MVSQRGSVCLHEPSLAGHFLWPSFGRRLERVEIGQSEREHVRGVWSAGENSLPLPKPVPAEDTLTHQPPSRGAAAIVGRGGNTTTIPGHPIYLPGHPILFTPGRTPLVLSGGEKRDDRVSPSHSPRPTDPVQPRLSHPNGTLANSITPARPDRAESGKQACNTVQVQSIGIATCRGNGPTLDLLHCVIPLIISDDHSTQNAHSQDKFVFHRVLKQCRRAIVKRKGQGQQCKVYLVGKTTLMVVHYVWTSRVVSHAYLRSNTRTDGAMQGQVKVQQAYSQSLIEDVGEFTRDLTPADQAW